jgi:hypothetical protein
VEERSSDRPLALAGIVFVVLILIAAFLPGSPPKTSDSAAKISKFVVDNGDQLRWAAFVGALASIVVLGWLGAVWRVMRSAEGGSPRFAVAAALGTAMAAALFNVGGILMATVAIIGVPHVGTNGTRFFYVFATDLAAGGSFGIALLVGAFSTVIIQTGVFPRVIGWFGALVAVVLIVAGASVASTRDVFFVLGFVGFIGFALWTIVVSVMMFRLAGAPRPAPLSAA